MTSVITIAKNHKSGLKRTLESIKQLEGTDFEVVLVIGESSDETLEEGRNFVETSVRESVLISQEGSGIYEAMNEGIKAAKGDSMIFMNAGDCFENPSSLRKMQTELDDNDVGVVIGGYVVDGLKQRPWIGTRIEITPLRFAFNRHGGCHQAMLYRTTAVKFFGGYPLDYRLAADFDLTLRIISTFNGLRIPILVALIEPGGVADMGIVQVHSEKHLSRKRILIKKHIVLYSLLWSFAAKTKIRVKGQFKKRF
jgi:glycosyltransferase involved in cell wall biosynthesis